MARIKRLKAPKVPTLAQRGVDSYTRYMHGVFGAQRDLYTAATGLTVLVPPTMVLVPVAVKIQQGAYQGLSGANNQLRRAAGLDPLQRSQLGSTFGVTADDVSLVGKTLKRIGG